MSILKNTNSWILYRHTSPSGKVYIGITSRTPEERWGKNGCRYKGSKAFYNAILKYGWNNIKHEILFSDLSEEDAKSLEITFIKIYKDLDISYNITDGGDGSKGHHPSSETTSKRINSTRKTGYKNQILVLNKNRKQIGIKHRKGVVQFSLCGDLICKYNSIKEASAKTKVDNSTISRCCKGKMFIGGHYLWMYDTDYVKYKELDVLRDILNIIVLKASEKSGSYIRTKSWRKNKSEQLKGKDFRSDQTKSKMSKRVSEILSIPVLQLTINGIPIRAYKNCREVTKLCGFNNSYISKCCRGIKPHAYNYLWKYLSDAEYNQIIHKGLNNN